MENALNRHPWLLPLILAVLAVVLLQPALLPPAPGHALDGNDFTGNFYPLHGYIAEQLRAGELPLWNPRQWIGFPVVGNPQAALFYPASWLVWWAGAPQGIGWMVVLHIFLAAWGMAVLARQMGSTHTAALAGGIVYGMSGWAGTRIYAGHYTIITVFAWIPWFVACYGQALNRRTWASLLPGTVVFGLMALAGHPQMAFYGAICAFLLGVVRIWDGEISWWAAGWRLAVLGGGGVLLGAALIVPTLELIGQSVRSTATDVTFSNAFALPPAQYVSFLLPHFFGNPKVPPSYYWGEVTFEEMTAYAGILPLVALFLAVRLRRTGYFVLLVVLGLLLSIGVEGVLLPTLVRWVPGFSLFRAPGRLLFFTVFGLAGLTALLLTRLQTSDDRREWLAPALSLLPRVGAVLFGLAIFFAGWFASASHVEPMPHRAFLIAGVLATSALFVLATWGVLWSFRHLPVGRALLLALALVVVDGWRANTSIITTTDITETPIWNGAAVNVPTGPESRLYAFIDPNDYFRNAVNNANLTGHLHINGYDPLELETFVTLKDAADNGDPNNPLFELIGLRYVATHEPREDAGWKLIGIAEGGIYYERERALPRAWVANAAQLQPDDNLARQMILNEEIEFLREVVLSAPLDCELGNAPGTAEIIEYRPNDVTLQVNSDGGVLVLSDQYYPGWRASLEGEPLEVVRAYTTLRAVCVPPGTHDITFSYRPLSAMIGASVSGVSWAIVLVMWIGTRLRRNGAGSPPRSG